jgi:hypothetical protein
VPKVSYAEDKTLDACPFFAAYCLDRRATRPSLRPIAQEFPYFKRFISLKIMTIATALTDSGWPVYQTEKRAVVMAGFANDPR